MIGLEAVIEFDLENDLENNLEAAIVVGRELVIEVMIVIDHEVVLEVMMVSDPVVGLAMEVSEIEVEVEVGVEVRMRLLDPLVSVSLSIKLVSGQLGVVDQPSSSSDSEPIFSETQPVKPSPNPPPKSNPRSSPIPSRRPRPRPRPTGRIERVLAIKRPYIVAVAIAFVLGWRLQHHPRLGL